MRSMVGSAENPPIVLAMSPDCCIVHVFPDVLDPANPVNPPTRIFEFCAGFTATVKTSPAAMFPVTSVQFDPPSAVRSIPPGNPKYRTRGFDGSKAMGDA